MGVVFRDGNDFKEAGTSDPLPVRSAPVSADANTGITADVELAVAAAAGLRLMGFCACEVAVTAAAAEVEILNGDLTNGTQLARITLESDGSHVFWFGPDGLDASDGLSINVIAGGVDVVLYHKTEA